MNLKRGGVVDTINRASFESSEMRLFYSLRWGRLYTNVSVMNELNGLEFGADVSSVFKETIPAPLLEAHLKFSSGSFAWNHSLIEETLGSLCYRKRSLDYCTCWQLCGRVLMCVLTLKKVTMRKTNLITPQRSTNYCWFQGHLRVFGLLQTTNLKRRERDSCFYGTRGHPTLLC